MTGAGELVWDGADSIGPVRLGMLADALPTALPTGRWTHDAGYEDGVGWRVWNDVETTGVLVTCVDDVACFLNCNRQLTAFGLEVLGARLDQILPALGGAVSSTVGDISIVDTASGLQVAARGGEVIGATIGNGPSSGVEMTS